MAEDEQTVKNKAPKTEQPVDIDEPGTDSVAEDINSFKKYFKMLTGGFHQKAKPVAQKVQQKVIEKTPPQIMEKVPNKAGFGWVKFLFIPLFIVFVIIIMMSLVKTSTENGDEENGEATETPGISEPTPTIEPFQPVRQSVYFDDPTVVDIQEQLDVVNNEMFSVPLRDSTLNPPVLDFNVEFE